MIRLNNRIPLQLSLCMMISIITLSSFAAEDSSDAKLPPEIVLDSPPPTQSPVKQVSKKNSDGTETVTIYESKVLPGFRPCTKEDYRNRDSDPIACQDEDSARVISTREGENISEDLIVEDDAVPQGNIYKLRFERFKKKK